MYKYVKKKSPLYAEFYSRNIMPFKPIPERDELQGRRDKELLVVILWADICEWFVFLYPYHSPIFSQWNGKILEYDNI